MQQIIKEAAIVPLSAKRWEDSRANAERLIGPRLTAPSRSAYKALDSQYPPRLIGIVVAMLLTVALAALYISAGKEIAVVDTVMRDLVSYYPRLTVAYIEVAIVGVLLLAELGALLFGLASRVLASRRSHGQLMRVFQISCVVVALVGNMTITLAHPVVEALIFDWVLTVGAPTLVIGIGAIIEELLATWLLARQQAIRDYNVALTAYQSALADPESHQEFFQLWGECIFEQLLKQSGHNREVLPPMLEADPGLKLIVVSLEWQRHQWSFAPEVAAEIARNFSPISGKLSPIGNAIATSGQLPEISAAISATPPRPMTVRDAVALFEADTALIDLPGKTLVERYGGSEPTYSKARGKYRELHPSAGEPNHE